MQLEQRLAYTPKFAHFDNDPDSALDAAAVLPEQFYSLPSNAYTGRPEVSLMQAVLEDAVNCFQYRFQETSRRNQRLAKEAEVWFFSNDTQGPFAFLNICTVLGLNSQYIRMGLRRWYSDQPKKFQRKKRRVVGSRRPLKLAA